MRSSLIGLLLLALLGVACGGSPAAVPDPAPAESVAPAEAASASPDTAAPAETSPAADESVAPTATAEDGEESVAEAPLIEGPPAPDFTLALADGSEFTLSAAAKPVYMVFWAEW